jgi:hypothetical protein
MLVEIGIRVSSLQALKIIAFESLEEGGTGRSMLTVINHQLYKSTRIKRRVKMSFTLDLGVLN